MTQTLLPAQGPVDVNVSPLPCPHCGSDDLYGPHLTEYIGDTRHPHWWIACNRCPGGMQVDGETAKPLIDAWNMRANASLTDTEPVGGTSELKR